MEQPKWKIRLEHAYEVSSGKIRLIGERIARTYQRHLGRFHPAVSASLLLGLTGLIGLFLAGLLALLVYLGLFGPLPSYGEIQNIRNATASEVYDANGVRLGKFYVENRTNADFEEITPEIVYALIATEDARFFEHSGVDFRAFGRVLFKSLLLGNESSGGGSTLSQQLAKNLYPRRSYWLLGLPINKFREMFIARRLENTYTKEELIRLYLNTVPFGDNIYGIKVASQRYFNRPPQGLRIEEVAVLIGLLKANSYYHPVRHPERAFARRNVVLGQMARYGYLKPSEADSLAEIPLETDYQVEGRARGRATYFREYLRQEVEELLKTYKKPNGRPYNLYQDGLRIYTTLDARLQQFAEDAVAEQMARLQSQFEKDWGKRERPWESRNNFLGILRSTQVYLDLADRGLSEEEIINTLKKPHSVRVFSWENEDREEVRDMSTLDSLRHYLNLLHAGFLAVEPQTGLVRAWVGGIDFRYFQYDHVKSKRQVGSVFKPVVYAQALRSGMLPCEYTANQRAIFPDYDDWSPRNADGQYEGVYSMEGALSHSVNTISVALLQRGGMDSTAMLARQMGIEGPIHPVPSMALGTTDASLWEMVTLFATLAAQGKRPVLHLLDRIETARGEVILEVRRPNPRYFQQVLDPQHAAVITRMMESVVDSGTARRLRSLYRLRGAIAGKTGTTQQQTDGWFLGFSPQLVAGAWVGAESPLVHFRSLHYGQGANTALPIWARFYQKVYANPNTRKWLAGRFTPPSDSMLSYMMCPPYLEEMPILADLWPDYRENPGFFNQWRYNGRFSGSDYQLRLKARKPNETDEEYYQRMEKLNQRKFKQEERRRKRRDYWSRVFFGKKKEEEGSQ